MGSGSKYTTKTLTSTFSTAYKHCVVIYEKYGLFYVKRDNLKLQYVTFFGLKLHFKKEFAALGQISQKIDIVCWFDITHVCMLRIRKQYLYKCVAFVL